MQSPKTRLTNQERTQATRAALISAARRLFVEKGYSDTGTPEIVAAAQVTRGALYHHFSDKAGLFMAVAQQAAAEVARAIATDSQGHTSPLEALNAGASAYFNAMAIQGRARLLLLDAPSILAPEQLKELSDLAGSSELHEGLAALLQPRAEQDVPLEELTEALSAAFDRAALAIANGADRSRYGRAIDLILKGLAGLVHTRGDRNH